MKIFISVKDRLIANNMLDGASKIWDKVGQAKEAVQSIVNGKRNVFIIVKRVLFRFILL